MDQLGIVSTVSTPDVVQVVTEGTFHTINNTMTYQVASVLPTITNTFTVLVYREKVLEYRGGIVFLMQVIFVEMNASNAQKQVPPSTVLKSVDITLMVTNTHGLI